MPISTEQENPGQAMAAYFREHGAKNVGIWLPKPRERVDDDFSLAELRDARGFYFSGGDQTRGMGLLRGTKALEVIRKRLARRGGDRRIVGRRRADVEGDDRRRGPRRGRSAPAASRPRRASASRATGSPTSTSSPAPACSG